MTPERESANAALLLDEEIDERIIGTLLRVLHPYAVQTPESQNLREYIVSLMLRHPAFGIIVRDHVKEALIPHQKPYLTTTTGTTKATFY